MSTWKIDEGREIGSGGFGKVYGAQGPVEYRLAAKVVPKADGATREHLIAADAPKSPHIVPIVHIEDESDSFVLFMPRADFSLRDRIGSGITAGEAIAVLIQVAEALEAIAPSIVHRDLKPDNVLFLDGVWALCDFGIARYAEAATASDTRKYSLSAQYAAPEQWRGERATAAADVYAFGVMAYELLSGERPFSGASDELRAQHLAEVPALLPGNRKLSWIVSECLQKAPEARPSAANLVLRLRRASVEAQTPGASALAAAQSAVLQERSAEQAQLEKIRTERERREALAASARIGFSALVEEIVEFITDSAPATNVVRTDGTVTMELRGARLRLSGTIDSAARHETFDVISSGEIRLEAGNLSRSHSLYYADMGQPGSYSWFELAFMSMAGDFDNEPRALHPAQGLGAFDRAWGGPQLAWGVVPLEIDDLDRFIDFWAERFGNAAKGQFPRIFNLPDGRVNHPTRRR